jgi:hypothetical protein
LDNGPGGGFFKKEVGDPNLFTVSQMPFFRGFISKVCRKNKVSEGISKKSPLAAGGRFVVVLENLLSFLENYRYYLIHPDNLYI